MITPQALLDYRRTVAGMYARLRHTQDDAPLNCGTFRNERDALFRHHSQSALSDAQKAGFTALTYYDYDASLRFEATIVPAVESAVIEITLADDGAFRMQRFGHVQLPIDGQAIALAVYWIMGYGGGIFLPFGDLTNGQETYGGGRYLLDTIKGADLGDAGERIVIDFNYAYNPSCAYNERWVCPLSPRENRMPVAIRAGEKQFTH